MFIADDMLTPALMSGELLVPLSGATSNLQLQAPEKANLACGRTNKWGNHFSICLVEISESTDIFPPWDIDTTQERSCF